MTMIKKAFQWIMYSSADPEKVSLTIKSAGVLVIGYLIPIIGLTHINIGGDPSTVLNGILNAATNLVDALLVLVGAVAGLFGICRKVYYSLIGQNQAVPPATQS